VAATGVAEIGMAFAQDDPYYIGASQVFTWESNVFRVAEGQPESKDTYSTTALLAGVNQPFGRGVDVGLDWETIESLSGRLGYMTKEVLARYGADQGPPITTLNLERSQEFTARAQ